MAWTAPETFSTSEVVTATKLNTNIRDNMKELWHEKSYVEFTSTVTNNTGTYSDVVSAGAVTYGGFPIIVETGCPSYAIAAGGALSLVGDGTMLGAIVGTGGITSFAARRFTPSAASHTYKIQIVGTGGGSTSTALAGAGGVAANMPGYIRVLERGG